ncbi:MAG: VRR-NUC domain-containing protein [Candidatus Marinimicrobia bacterium]|nr:VRR-NUC domain-containing protein [Candidatus Neomarinimicrobiota bacterium]
MWFGQNWPEYNGLLFEINNNPKNKAHGVYRKSMGMKKNVSDLILVEPKQGHTIGIELKAPGSKHSSEHIKNQIDWGKQLINNGGYYIMTSDLSTLKEFISDIIKGDYLSAMEIQYSQLIFVGKQLGVKTIKF